LRLVEEHDPDVVFLDIKMPELEGDQAARMLAARKDRPLLVFSTAHEDYAVEAFKLNAVDYLLKPTEPQRLRETLQRVRKRLAETSGPQAGKVSKLIVEESSRLVVIDPAAIMYAVRDDRVVRICTETEVYTTRMTLQQLEEKLQAHSFFRTHKSYLVNLQYVSELEPWFNGAYNLILKGPKKVRVPVSRTAAKDLLKRLEG